MSKGKNSNYPSYIIGTLTERYYRKRSIDSLFFIRKWEWKYILKALKLMNQKIIALERLTSVNSLSKPKYKSLLHMIRRNSYP